jgi:hypothetical protein
MLVREVGNYGSCIVGRLARRFCRRFRYVSALYQNTLQAKSATIFGEHANIDKIHNALDDMRVLTT